MPGKGKPFEKGEDPRRNTDGRPPKGYSITEMMQEMLTAQPDLKKAIGQRIAKKALEGDVTAIKTLWQYMDGMPVQETKTDLTSGGEKIEGIAVEFIRKPQ